MFTHSAVSAIPGEENKALRLTLATNLDFLPSHTTGTGPGDTAPSPGLAPSGNLTLPHLHRGHHDRSKHESICKEQITVHWAFYHTDNETQSLSTQSNRMIMRPTG